eukprot:scaffold15156_cov101-Isochrysis_galbana.AAC.4
MSGVAGATAGRKRCRWGGGGGAASGCVPVARAARRGPHRNRASVGSEWRGLSQLEGRAGDVHAPRRGQHRLERVRDVPRRGIGVAARPARTPAVRSSADGITARLPPSAGDGIGSLRHDTGRGQRVLPHPGAPRPLDGGKHSHCHGRAADVLAVESGPCRPKARAAERVGEADDRSRGGGRSGGGSVGSTGGGWLALSGGPVGSAFGPSGGRGTGVAGGLGGRLGFGDSLIGAAAHLRLRTDWAHRYAPGSCQVCGGAQAQVDGGGIGRARRAPVAELVAQPQPQPQRSAGRHFNYPGWHADVALTGIQGREGARRAANGVRHSLPAPRRCRPLPRAPRRCFSPPRHLRLALARRPSPSDVGRGLVAVAQLEGAVLSARSPGQHCEGERRGADPLPVDVDVQLYLSYAGRVGGVAPGHRHGTSETNSVGARSLVEHKWG